MPGTPQIRGRINVILNGLVRDGVITGFRTNLYARQPEDAIVVTITTPNADEPAQAEEQVRQALGSVEEGIIVKADRL